MIILFAVFGIFIIAVVIYLTLFFKLSSQIKSTKATPNQETPTQETSLNVQLPNNLMNSNLPPVLPEINLSETINKINCEVNDWSEWSTCSKTCGGGSKTRSRTVKTQPKNGGTECPTLNETDVCNTQECPINCEVNNWSDWSSCSKTCGGGSKTRSRTVKTEPKNGGTTCPTLNETDVCNTQECPVNCEVNDWTNWSSCSKTCGGGSKTRNRTVKTEPKNGGTVCPTLNETDVCNTQECPINCGLSEWSNWSSCSKTCGGGTRTRLRSILTEPKYGGEPCGKLQESEVCNTQNCPPVNCVVGNWSEWSPCSKSCDTGNQIRTRSIITNPEYGGTACPVLSESKLCNTNPCSFVREDSKVKSLAQCKTFLNDYSPDPNNLVNRFANAYTNDCKTPNNSKNANSCMTMACGAGFNYNNWISASHNALACDYLYNGVTTLRNTNELQTECQARRQANLGIIKGVGDVTNCINDYCSILEHPKGCQDGMILYDYDPNEINCSKRCFCSQLNWYNRTTSMDESMKVRNSNWNCLTTYTKDICTPVKTSIKN